MSSKIIDTECVHILRHHKGAVLNVEFTVNGAYCISTSQDKSLILWNPNKGTVIKQYQGPHNHEVNDVTITNDNSRFASCGGDKAAFLWDVTTGHVIKKFAGHNGKLNCCQFFGNDGLLITGCYDKAVRIWDMKAPQSYKPVQTLTEAKDAISSIMIPDDYRLLITSIDGYCRCYDIRTGRLYTDQFPNSLLRGGLSRDKRCYVANCLDSTIRLVELDSGQHLNVFQGHKNTNYSLNSQISPDDAFVVSGSEDGRICVWDLMAHTESDGLLQELRMSSTTVRSNDSNIDTINSKNEQSWGCVFTVRFHPTEWTLLTCHNDRCLRVWKKKH